MLFSTNPHTLHQTSSPSPGAFRREGSLPPRTPDHQGPDARFTVERRTPGLVWSERLGCFLATIVACIPPLLFCRWTLPVLIHEGGFLFLLLLISLILGACISILIGLAISVFIWWLPRLAYIALNSQVQRSGVQAGVKSRGIWIAGIGWLPWNGLHIHEKNDPFSANQRCTTLVIKTPRSDSLVLYSPDHAEQLLFEIRQFMEYQPTEFVNSEFPNTEILPPRPSDSNAFHPAWHTPVRELSPIPEPKQKQTDPAFQREFAKPEFQSTEILAEDNTDHSHTEKSAHKNQQTGFKPLL